MKKERPKLIPTAYLVLVRENKILLSRRFNTGFQDGQYSFPAGHLGGDEETLSQAMIREAREEIGVEIDVADLELAHVMHRKQREPTDERRINLFFRAKKWEGEPRIMEPNKCDDLQWFELDRLPDNTIPYVRQAIGCLRKNVKYSEYGF
jgi:ADP-ribose pyrophosphatase YjhB (NUDIX family)